ncbi:hypothetical protein L6164_030424 [Bauhinia variegata]|uniref:Uncharacterized protein n=1 Tax=Bauhinia variegata TaxID=167791 RepID=A0ACB9LDN4_BAUVA|nr:hypothetical protein L6164_030424 [Bauhinia variegata]
MVADKKQQLIPLLLAILLAAEVVAGQSKPGCPVNCGSVSIPYPFGTREGCYLDESFLITCRENSSSSIPFLGHSNVSIVDISLQDGELRIPTSVAHDCYNHTGFLLNSSYSLFDLPHFSVSSTRNELTTIGCDTVGIVFGWDYEGKNYTTGCVSLCNKLDDIEENGSCSGTGCCQAPVPQQGLKGSFWMTLATDNHTRIDNFNPCGYAFFAEQGTYNFSPTDLVNFRHTSFAAVVDWAVANQTCQQAQNDPATYACVAKNSECIKSNDGAGYRCKCSSGFWGNPYLVDGCQDIDECVESDPCNGTCLNSVGGFKCLCPEGYEGDGLKSNGTGCVLKDNSNSMINILLLIILSVTVSFLVLLVISFYIYWGSKKRKIIKQREKFFQQNGGILLQQRIANHRGSVETAKIFTIEELKIATNNFEEKRVIGQGGYGTVYKGVIPNNTIVAIKKSNISDRSQIEQFINEVTVLSQINHRNVVKLLGCCLETEVPLLVYEYTSNGCLSSYIHCEIQSCKLSWAMRLRIATETAGALAYLHSATSIPIIHRDVKPTNILLDHNLTAKVSDFGASRFVPLDQSQLTTLVQGTWGYLDPEYVQTSQLTEKSDVYSFGVVLAEFLTGMKALSFERPESHRNLSMYFVSSLREGRLLQIVDKHILDEANIEQIMEVANLVELCLRVKGEGRPTMKEVAMELEGLRTMGRHAWGGSNESLEETEYLLNANARNPAAMMYSINQISTTLEYSGR